MSRKIGRRGGTLKRGTKRKGRWGSGITQPARWQRVFDEPGT